MAQTIVRGNIITLDAYYRDGSGVLATPTNPRVSILNPSGVTVVSLATPSAVATGHFQYAYSVADDAPLGAWAAQWFGTVDGSPLEDEDGFTVLAVGSISGGTTGSYSTCTPWADASDLCTPCDDYALDAGLLDDSLQAASDVLFNLTGRRWPGACETIIRPQARWRALDVPRWWPGGSASPWGWCSCQRGRETGCSSVAEVRLPGIQSVDPGSVSVLIDGEAFEGFRLDDGHWLVRTDGEGWPCCQRLDLEPDETDTWQISYQRGGDPPVGGRMAAASLACQFALACNPEAIDAGACRLPKRITSITRQGVTIAVLDPLTLFADGLTGLGEVDLWVASVMKGDQRRSGGVLVPGRARASRSRVV